MDIVRGRYAAVIARTEAKKGIRERQHGWLTEVLRITRSDPTPLAAAVGVSPNLLTRFLKADGDSVLSPLTIRLICEYTGLPGPDEAEGNLQGLGFEEGRQFDYTAAERSMPVLALLVRTAIGSRSGAAPWLLVTHALEDAGYLPGDVVIVDLNELPRAGDMVCAQIYDAQRGTAETVFRLYEPPYLMAVTKDRTLRKPVQVDDRWVIIKGVITESFRTRSSASKNIRRP